MPFDHSIVGETQGRRRSESVQTAEGLAFCLIDLAFHYPVAESFDPFHPKLEDIQIPLASGSRERRGDDEKEEESNKVYVAVGRDKRESLRALKWALAKLAGNPNVHLLLLHIELPLRFIPTPVGRIPVERVRESMCQAHRIDQRIALREFFRKYLALCAHAKVKASVVPVEKPEVASGLVNIVSELRIRRLIVGSTSMGGISKRMRFQGVSITEHLKKYAPRWCDIAIVSGKSVQFVSGAGFLQSMKRPVVCDDEADAVISPSGCNTPSYFFHGVAARDSDVSTSLSVASTSSSSSNCSCSDAASVQIDLKEKLDLSEMETEEQLYRNSSIMYFDNQSMPRGDRNDNDKIPGQEQVSFSSLRVQVSDSRYTNALREAEEAKICFAEEKERRLRAELEARGYKQKTKEWKRKAKDNTSLLLLTKELLDNSKRQIDERDKTVQALQCHLNESLSRLKTVTEALDEERLKNCALIEQKDIIIHQRNDAIKRLNDLLQARPRSEVPSLPLIWSPDVNVQAYSFEEIKAATCNFSEHFKLGEGTYKGEIKEKTVAIKLVNIDSLECLRQVQNETELMQRVRHPHVVRIIGACVERGCIVHEYLPNGCLADQLFCSGRQGISWHARVRIAAEMCTALAALHNCRSGAVVHGNLQLKYVLLDENQVSKIGGFRLASQLPITGDLDLVREPRPNHGLPSVDQEGRVTTKCDVHSFGMILLQLLTGKKVVAGLAAEVERALNGQRLLQVLDPSAQWPHLHATELAYLALSCTDENPSKRPDFHPTLLRILDRLRDAVVGDSTGTGKPERTNAFAVFFCPILQEMMHNPYIAADGFTYEYEAIKAWLDGGHDTSPMTNLNLAHRTLVPNHALRSAIRQWQQDAGYPL